MKVIITIQGLCQSLKASGVIIAVILQHISMYKLSNTATYINVQVE
jgi:hypothetical protein